MESLPGRISRIERPNEKGRDAFHRVRVLAFGVFCGRGGTRPYPRFAGRLHTKFAALWKLERQSRRGDEADFVTTDSVRLVTSAATRGVVSAFAFTLIELLMTVAVIALLAALLAPILSGGKRAANRIKCVANLRELGVAGQMYWDDNAGAAFRWRGVSTNGGQIYWFGWLGDGSEGRRKFDPTFGALYPYLGGRGIEVCPAFNYLSPQLKLKATGASYGYGYNLELSTPTGEPPKNIHRLARAADLVFLADAAQINTFQAPARPEHPMIEEFYYLSIREPTVHFRHNRTVNAVFCDGHVATERPAPNSLDRRLPKQTIGRLRSEILVAE